MTIEDLMVEVQKARKNFGRPEALKGVDMEVPCGTVTCLIGSSGSGKFTLLRCINHLEKVDADRLYVDSSLIGYREKNGSLCEISTVEVARQRRDIGMVFQNLNLFPHRTVLGNITEASVLVKDVLQEQAKKRTTELLETAGLAHKVDAYPVQFSGDQQQHVAIARVLVMEPKLMFLDELTSALDPKLVGEILNVMHGPTDKGVTMVVMTCEMGFVREVADQVVFMADGVAAEKGTPDEVLGNLKHERTRNLLSSLLK